MLNVGLLDELGAKLKHRYGIFSVECGRLGRDEVLLELSEIDVVRVGALLRGVLQQVVSIILQTVVYRVC